MSPSLAVVVCICGMAGLFVLERDRSVRTSGALWLPLIWLLIVGSRPVSVWLGANPQQTPAQLLEGSPLDRIVYQILLAAGLVVLFTRKKKVMSCLSKSWPILIYFGYSLLSVLWSDFPDVSFKRWVKALGDLVMVLIVVTDPKPVMALQRLLSRAGIILLPLSLVFIKYLPIGRGYDPDGNPMNVGVTTNKNTLGVITCVLAVGALWRVWMLIRAKRYPQRVRHLLAQGTILAFGVAVLVRAHSSTSLATFGLCGLLIALSGMPSLRGKTRRVHAVVFLLVAISALTIALGGIGYVTHALGREEHLTGRTAIWAAVFRGVDDPLLGAGFENFWIGPRLMRVWSGLSAYMHVNEAHNGYLEVYLNLGLIGVALIGVALFDAYRKAVGSSRRNPEIGGLMLAYVAGAAVYSCTEAGFRMLNPMWIFFLLAAVGAGALASSGEPQITPGRKRVSSPDDSAAAEFAHSNAASGGSWALE